jgi:hypothetical protein
MRTPVLGGLLFVAAIGIAIALQASNIGWLIAGPALLAAIAYWVMARGAMTDNRHQRPR